MNVPKKAHQKSGRSKKASVDSKAKETAVKLFVHSVSATTTSEKRIKSVDKVLKTPFVYEYDDYLVMWKGFFYCIWYAEMDKDCQNIIFRICYDSHFANLGEFFAAGFKVLTNEWTGMDQYRVDKYYFLTRHMLNRCLRLALYDSDSRDFDFIDKIVNTIEPVSEFICHICEIYLEELDNVLVRQVIWDPSDKAEVFSYIIKPWIKVFAITDDSRTSVCINEYIFDELRKKYLKRGEDAFRVKLSKFLSTNLMEVAKDPETESKNRKIMYHLAEQMKSYLKI
ncbi:ribosomal RNA processing protein 1 homolog Nnp-1 [Brevipalpus obovatus]|uniref:ribosomal RNA processing protein 1 homolog Nnp-1 n=1 Tax=Brevipalpus obovatus TaxID=246614 RepID=UPI003D9FA2E6